MRALWPILPLTLCAAALSSWSASAVPAAPAAAPQEAERTWHEVAIQPGAMWLAAVEVNGRPMTLLVDTGASQNVISKRAAAAAGIEGKFQMPAMGVGAEMVSIAQLDTLKVGNWSGTEQVCALMDLSGAAASMPGLDGILGMPFLMKFKFVEFDFHRRVLRLADFLPGEERPPNMVEEMLKGRQPTKRPTPGEAGPSGATLERATGGLRVTAVDAGSRAEAAGLRVGDLIEEIDEEAAEDPGQLDARLKEVRLGKVTVTGRRAGGAFKVRVPARLAKKGGR
ncbi:MAG: retropepsin-like aspartic protease [Planctomycetota bacterium]|jgi:predicted aspartyl protease